MSPGETGLWVLFEELALETSGGDSWDPVTTWNLTARGQRGPMACQYFYLLGALEDFWCSPIVGMMIQSDSYFSGGRLKPPISYGSYINAVMVCYGILSNYNYHSFCWHWDYYRSSMPNGLLQKDPVMRRRGSQGSQHVPAFAASGVITTNELKWLMWVKQCHK